MHVAQSFARNNYAFLKIYRFIIRYGHLLSTQDYIDVFLIKSYVFIYNFLFWLLFIFINFTDNKINFIIACIFCFSVRIF